MVSMEENKSNTMYKLVPGDSEHFQEITLEGLKRSELLNNMVVDLDSEMIEIPIPNLSSDTMKKIIRWCEMSVLNEDKTGNERDLVDQHPILKNWEEEFLNVDHQILFELISGANYLDIKCLLEKACYVAATHIKGKSPEEIRNFFNIECDFTDEELETIRQENEWCENTREDNN